VQGPNNELPAAPARSGLSSLFNWLRKTRRPRPRSLAKVAGPLQDRPSGEMAEWLKAHAWKACVRETVPWVRIPLSPPAWPPPAVFGLSIPLWDYIDTEVHLHLFAALPATPAEVLSRTGLSDAALPGKVEAIDTAAGSAEVKADWAVEDPTSIEASRALIPGHAEPRASSRFARWF
jgi:hypothetical protein